MSNYIPVKLRLTTEAAKLPVYTTAGAGAADVCSVDTFTLMPGETRLVNTGLIAEIPEGYAILVLPRSGLALKNSLTVLNAPGLVDSDYRGEIGVILHNAGKLPCIVNAGERVAQFMIQRVDKAVFEGVEFVTDTARGTGGFGHTGR